MDIAALVVSIFAVVLTVALFLVRLPRVVVEHTRDAQPGTPAPEGTIVEPDGSYLDSHGNTHSTLSEQRFRVVVVNHGSEAITVRSIGIVDEHGKALKDESGAILLDYEESQNRGYLRRVGGGAVLTGDFPLGPELPARVDGHGCVVWRYPTEQLEPIRGKQARAYAVVYRSAWLPFLPVKSRRVLAPRD
ncbi:hypothetical protein GONAM_16_00230 [Gordonia namibiensis NBRC 108229]|uniref:Uncharacterized protein n=1 Tax=Gordonia namibiensis NBRC 108229 TaxID=1208314 RepID=K6VWB5_9ACTN|nr:hypothetical protein [Gordonia namibiensis]GAC00524.1 hypothetical protein GONAM_16_00230 [Gordonia namibiensis NBRC 108229]